MLGIKTFIKKKLLYPTMLFPKETGTFPDVPTSSLRMKARLWGMKNKLKEQKKYDYFGNIITYPYKNAVKVWNMLLPFNPNNLGNWSIKEVHPNHETGKIEREVIWQMIDLYQGKKDDIEGYVTTGATEANIFSSWIGSNYLQSKNIARTQMICIQTSLTHYSIAKAADIIGVASCLTPLNDKMWCMDIDGLEKTVKELVVKGYRGFLLPLTIGYTVTGTIDPYEDICKKIRVLEKSLKIHFFVWMDAALNGLIEPFIHSTFRPFAYPEIQTVLTDFHKFGCAPIPAGVVLYRRELRKYVEASIDYLDEKDSTLLGSRSGIAPVVCWSIIHHLGRKLFTQKILAGLERKKNYMRQFDRKQFRFIQCPTSLTCGIIPIGKHRHIKKIEKKYNLKFRKNTYLFMHGKKEVTIAREYFLHL